MMDKEAMEEIRRGTLPDGSRRSHAEADSETWARRVTRLPQPRRLVAIGDLHGDFVKAKEALCVAGVLDRQTERWTGGDTVVVQVGDILDRGSKEISILCLLRKLQMQAKRCGGMLIMMLGNHEILNMQGDFRYTSNDAEEGFKVWKKNNIRAGTESEEDYEMPLLSNPSLLRLDEDRRIRAAALQPGGPVTRRFFAKSPVVLIVGSTVFVHGGLRPEHVRYGLERINAETRDWVLGRREGVSSLVSHPLIGMTWIRSYSYPDEYESSTVKKLVCSRALDEVLGSIPGVKRMVVGHTIQEDGNITAHFDGKVIAVDVGMSSGCSDSDVQVLEIDSDDQISVLADGVRMPMWYYTNCDRLPDTDTSNIH